jgi:hypothetical protein
MTSDSSVTFLRTGEDAMTRRSTWLPGQPRDDLEPGRAWDQSGTGTYPSLRTPLEYAVAGGMLAAGAAATLIVGFVMGMSQIPSALVFFVVIALVFLAPAVWLVVLACRRQAWRRRYARRRGMAVLKPWQRTPEGYR